MKRFSKATGDLRSQESASSQLTPYERVEARNAAQDSGLSMQRWIDQLIREALAARGKVDRGQQPEWRPSSTQEMIERLSNQWGGTPKRPV